MSAPFGCSGPGLLQRLRPVRIGVAEVRAAADAVFPALATHALRLAVVERVSGGAVVVVEEGEHRLRVPLADLAEDMTDAGVTPDGVARALAAWVAHRPVSDSTAAEAGIAALDWADTARSAIGWTVVVVRDGVPVRWRPTAGTAARAVGRIRAAATRRAADVRPELRVEGPVALWSHPAVPLLATAVLVAPERVLGRIAEAGLEMPDMHVVITPHRPLACAGPGVAARLAGQTSEDRITLPWQELAGLPWF